MSRVQHHCPTCGRPIAWTEQYPYRPFCSDRCRLVDLGAWLSGGRAIAGDPADSSDSVPPHSDGPPQA